MKAAIIAAALADRAEDVAVALLGKPSRVSAHELRWGRKGSRSLRRTGSKRGVFCDHESGVGGDLLTLIAIDRGVGIAEAMRIAERDFLGSTIPMPPAPAAAVSRPDNDAARIAAALRLWNQAVPIAGTRAETYLVEHRKLDVRGLDLGHVLRFHAGQSCMIALMTDAVTNEPRGVHRTFLNQDGAKIDRRMLGRKGVIRLSSDEDVALGLGIVEGVEDGLAVLLSGFAPVWAAGDAGALARFSILNGIECLTVFADDDAPGMAAARHCVARWNEAGKEARVSPPIGGRHNA